MSRNIAHSGTPKSLATQVEHLFDQLSRAYRNWKRRNAIYNRTYRELAALSERDLADLAIVRGDIDVIARAAANEVGKGQ